MKFSLRVPLKMILKEKLNSSKFRRIPTIAIYSNITPLTLCPPICWPLVVSCKTTWYLNKRFDLLKLFIHSSSETIDCVKKNTSDGVTKWPCGYVGVSCLKNNGVPWLFYVGGGEVPSCCLLAAKRHAVCRDHRMHTIGIVKIMTYYIWKEVLWHLRDNRHLGTLCHSPESYQERSVNTCVFTCSMHKLNFKNCWNPSLTLIHIDTVHLNNFW